MIYNERQYRITAGQVQRLNDSLHHPLSAPESPGWLLQAQRNALQSEIDKLESEMREYELLRSGNVVAKTVSDLSELPKMLIRARIAAGMTQKQLAQRLGIPEPQLQRYEETEYAGANLSRLIQVSKAVGLAQFAPPHTQ